MKPSATTAGTWGCSGAPLDGTGLAAARCGGEPPPPGRVPPPTNEPYRARSDANEQQQQCSAANDFSSDARRLADQAAASGSRVADDAQDELARLRGQVERLMQERVTPALAGAADQVSDYANRARDAIEDQAETLSETVRERPLLAVGIAVAAGYLIGRLMGGNTYVYPRGR